MNLKCALNVRKKLMMDADVIDDNIGEIFLRNRINENKTDFKNMSNQTIIKSQKSDNGFKYKF